MGDVKQTPQRTFQICGWGDITVWAGSDIRIRGNTLRSKRRCRNEQPDFYGVSPLSSAENLANNLNRLLGGDETNDWYGSHEIEHKRDRIRCLSQIRASCQHLRDKVPNQLLPAQPSH